MTTSYVWSAGTATMKCFPVHPDWFILPAETMNKHDYWGCELL